MIWADPTVNFKALLLGFFDNEYLTMESRRRFCNGAQIAETFSFCQDASFAIRQNPRKNVI